MLDEIKEYKIYSGENTKFDRICLGKDSGHCTGVKRYFTIIARGMIYDPDGNADLRAIDKIKEELSKKKKDLLNLKNAPKRFLIHFENEEANDLNTITVNRIIAAALDKGPLKTGYLVATKLKNEKDLLGTEDDPKIRVYYKNGRELGKETEIFQARELLKLLATYLIEKDHGCNNCVIVMDDVKNWSSKKQKAKLNTDYVFKWCLPDGSEREIFKNVKTKEKNNNYTKITFDRDWIKMCGWHILTKEQLEMLLNKAPATLYYADNGYKLKAKAALD